MLDGPDVRCFISVLLSVNEVVEMIELSYETYGSIEAISHGGVLSPEQLASD